MIQLGFIGSDSIEYAGLDLNGSQNPSMGGTAFSLFLNAVGQGSTPVTDANLKKVTALSFNGTPSAAYGAIYRINLGNTSVIEIEVANFQAVDAGLEVTGIYWVA